jgi:hypothetical protein
MRTRRIGRPRLDQQPQGRRDGRLQAEILAFLREHIPALEVRGWKERTLEAFAGTEEVELAEEDFRKYILDFNYIPDGFVIDKEEMRLDFFEVEITSLMKRTKLQAYGEFKTIMDYYAIEFSLFSVNQHGHINEVPLLEHYLDWINAQAAAIRGHAEEKQ